MAQTPFKQSSPNDVGTKEKSDAQPQSFLKRDFPIIRGSVIRLAVSLVASLLMIVASQFLLSKQEIEKAQAQSTFRAAQEKFRTITNETNDILQYQPPYLQLVKRGFVGEEKRIDAIEHIRSIQESRRLFPINYQIFPQQLVQMEATNGTVELELRASRMVLRMGLLHEVDLLLFLNDLASKGTFVPQKCNIVTKDLAATTKLVASLDAECSLYWVTIGRRAAPENTSGDAAIVTGR